MRPDYQSKVMNRKWKDFAGTRGTMAKHRGVQLRGAHRETMLVLGGAAASGICQNCPNSFCETPKFPFQECFLWLGILVLTLNVMV